mgnify:CR=1 FL=1|jgi:hypothetical protein
MKLLETYLAACSARSERPLLAAVLSDADTTFRLADLSLGNAGLVTIAAALRTVLKAEGAAEHGFKAADLSRVHIPAAGVKELLAALSLYDGFESLAVCECELGDGVHTLSPALAASRLTSLALEGNGIGNRGAAAIAEAVAASDALRTLDLRRNEIKCQGAVALAAALQVHRDHGLPRRSRRGLLTPAGTFSGRCTALCAWCASTRTKCRMAGRRPWPRR